MVLVVLGYVVLVVLGYVVLEVVLGYVVLVVLEGQLDPDASTIRTPFEQ